MYLAKRIVILLLFVSIFLLSLFSSPKVAKTQSLPISYDFENGIISDWYIKSGNWSVQNILGSKRFGASIQGICHSSIETRVGNLNWANYEINLDILPTIGTDRNIAFRATSSRTHAFNLDLPVAYALHMSSGFVHLQKFIQNTPGDSSSNIEEPQKNNTEGISTNSITHLKIRLVDTNIKVFINDEQTPAIDWTDNSSNPILSGNLALIITTGGDCNSEIWFDNVTVIEITSPTPTPTATPTPTPTPTPSPTPTPTPTPSPSPTPTPTQNSYVSLNVTDLKQYSGGWENDNYDNTTGTIKQFGCALTSASMVLKYRGHNINPNTLNDWLKSQSDGYLTNGLVNWLAISRYTYLNKSLSSPALEFRRVIASDSNLMNELNNDRPAILKEPGHFIVTKSQTANSFGINDPGYDNRPTLASYNGSYSSIYSYRPTFTNLAYILLTLSSNYSLKIYDPTGAEITGYTYTEEGINDDTGGDQNSGGSLTVFEYPTPAVGQYTIEVTGPSGPYTIKSYTYDEAGNLTDNGPTITTTSSFNLYLNYDSDSSTPPIETGAVISDQSSTTPSSSTAIISWTTDKSSSSRVIYDTVSHSGLDSSPNYGYLFSSDTFDSVSKVISHSVLLTGLSSNQIYYYRIISAASPTAVSAEGTFKTLSVAGAPAPAGSNNIVTKSITFFPSYKTIFVPNEFPIEIKPAANQKTTQAVLGEEVVPTKTFFMKNLGWFITLFLSSGGLLLIQLRRLLRLIAKRKSSKEKHGNRNRQTIHAKPLKKRRHN